MLSIPFLDIHIARGMFGAIVVRTVFDEQSKRVRVLQVNGAWQSATYLDHDLRFSPVFPYYASFERMFDVGAPIKRVLMLGGGGYAYPKLFFSKHPKLKMDVVEIDPAITKIARKLFFIDDLIREYDLDSQLKIIEEDGRNFLETATMSETRYSAIVNDTFSGPDPVGSLATVEAMRLAKNALTPGGLYLTNVVSRTEGADISFLQDVVATLTQVFKHVVIVPCSDDDFGQEDNYLVMASDNNLDLPDAIGYNADFLGTVMHD